MAILRGRMLVTLAHATSIDAFAIGLNLAVLRIGIIIPSIVIGLVATVFIVSVTPKTNEVVNEARIP